jgi:hypothetical protein
LPFCNLPTAEPTEQVVNYVIEEMKKWGENGIQITKEDVTYALAGTLFNGDMGLCVNTINITKAK